MNLSLRDLKAAMYTLFGLFGSGALVLALVLDRSSFAVDDPTYHLSAFILLIAGSSSLFFCVESYLLRGEDDIWQ
jgi:hypothetical protein